MTFHLHIKHILQRVPDSLKKVCNSKLQLEIWGKAKCESTQHRKSDCEKILFGGGGLKFPSLQSHMARTQMQ